MDALAAELIQTEIRVLLGERARRAPAWWYTRPMGEGVVMVVGASRMVEPHPFSYGCERTDLFCNGEMILRPATAIGTDRYKGFAAGQLLTNYHDEDEMLAEGERVLAIS